MNTQRLKASHRRALRRAVEIPCDVVSSRVDEPLLYWATDLSPHGLWLETTFPMLVGEQLVVCFQPPVWWPGGELSVFAEVARSTRGGAQGMGLEFLDLDQHEARALHSWLRGRPPPFPRRRKRSLSKRTLPTPRYLC